MSNKKIYAFIRSKKLAFNYNAMNIAMLIGLTNKL
jgi:hypothetical protein